MVSELEKKWDTEYDFIESMLIDYFYLSNTKDKYIYALTEQNKETYKNQSLTPKI